MRDLSESVGGGIARLGIDSASRLLEVEDVANYLGMRMDRRRAPIRVQFVCRFASEAPPCSRRSEC